MDAKTFYHSKDFRRALAVLVALILILLAFEGGIAVGERRAEFSEHFGETYSRVFENNDGSGMMRGRPMPYGYGATGRVVSVASNSFTVALPDQSERIVVVSPDTLVRQFRNSATSSDIKVNDSVIVIGAPTPQGEIDARLVRIISTSTAPTQ